jgi:hypothetical protein
MTTLFTYARDAETANPLLAAVATDDGAEYVWPKGVEPWFDFEERKEFLLAPDEEPATATDWLSVAIRNLGDFIYTDVPYDDASNPDQAKRIAAKYLNTVYQQPDPTTNAAPDAFDQVAQDYPGFGDSDETFGDEEGSMENLVLMALGPIDPDGPNGWIQRAMDGAPAPGDENEYVHFPGTIPSGNNDEETE